ncbi:Helix-turn-helix [Carboxydocella sporoproducens DSM 16521]|uniref:Helix-turn-helix n=2 Tax=Carboxydocella TaxID=178898 RepID=A0A1T4QCV8_9FIRM|nr:MULTISPECIES: helix-turn-helix transcriptional regulator [Carboxydocella]AVX21639.1 helix-turn-helix protein [Carboxydocella thermautotrophica]SKA01572.1 Helix-turn-helix [Carboxydocella sporoproducens DSM 16521]
MDKLGEYIRNKRKERGLSLRECARMCDISHSYLDSLEKGKDPRTNKPVSPTIDTLKKISKGLGVPINELLEAADIKTDPNHLGRTDEMEAIEEATARAEKMIADAVADDPELLEFWQELTKRDDLQLLFKQVRDLPPVTIKRIIRYIKMVEDEEADE